MRVAPMLARLGGTFEQKAGLVAELGKGQAPEVAAETTQAGTGYLAHLDPILATRKLRQLTRDANYRPMEQDEQGRFVWKPEAIATLQKHFRRIPKSALYQAFGRSIEGVQAAEAFIDADLGEAAQAGSSAPSAAKPTEGERQRLKRAQTDVERANVEIKVGEKVVEQQAKRNEIYKGHRKIQAAVDTVKSYIPSRAAGAVDIAEAAVVEDVTNYQKWKDQPVTPKVGAGSAKGAATATVEIGPASSANLARAIAKSPIIAKPNKSTAAQAVEDSKAKNRSGANF